MTPCKWCDRADDEGCDCKERLNCGRAGLSGHLGCGRCVHDPQQPVFVCAICFQAAANMREHTNTVEVICRECGITYKLTVDAAAYMRWRRREATIQACMPSLSPADRELLISQTCGACFDLLFAPSDEDEWPAEAEEES